MTGDLKNLREQLENCRRENEKLKQRDVSRELEFEELQSRLENVTKSRDAYKELSERLRSVNTNNPNSAGSHSAGPKEAQGGTVQLETRDERVFGSQVWSRSANGIKTRTVPAGMGFIQ